MNKAYLSKFLSELRASYWFIPSLMVIGAVLLSVLTVWLDGQIKSDWPEKIPFVFSNRPDGARSLLATVAGSMITVASVTFSLTLLAVSHATGQFGPRLLNNFMRDRGNQFTLGTFTATFIFCILVLRTVRTAEELPIGVDSAEGVEILGIFVPHISVTIALVLSLCSVGVLIYFFHHIPESIRLSNVVSGIGKLMTKSIDELFPEQIAFAQPEEVEETSREVLPDDFLTNSVSITKDASGFLQTIDDDGVMHVAKQHGLIVHLTHRPGDFYCSGRELMQVWPAENVTDEVRAQLAAVVAIGAHRTMNQNTMFAFDQLVEVAQRALSPGVNDPFSAMDCINWLETGLVDLTQRKPPREFRYSEEGKLRVFAQALKFEDFCDAVFGQLRQYVAADRNASRHMIRSINNIRRSAVNESQCAILDHHADRLIEAATAAKMYDFDLEELRGQVQRGREEGKSHHEKWVSDGE